MRSPSSLSGWRSDWPTGAIARLTAAGTIVLIGVLEILQLWVPGRHARLEDFVVDALAASAGLLLVTAIEWIRARRSSPSTT